MNRLSSSPKVESLVQIMAMGAQRPNDVHVMSCETKFEIVHIEFVYSTVSNSPSLGLREECTKLCLERFVSTACTAFLETPGEASTTLFGGLVNTHNLVLLSRVLSDIATQPN